MTKASDNIYPKLLMSLNTSSPAAPSDASWKMYSKANGIYARSSNSEIGPFGASASGGISSGTSFPGGPATNDLYYRTDRALLYYYDGTRWLCTCPHVMPLRQWQNVSGGDTLSSIYPVPGGGGANGIYLVSFRGYFLQGGGTSATNYMTASLHRWDASTDTADVSTVSSQNNTVGDFTIESATINAVLTSGTDALDVKLTETGSVTGFYGTTEIEYRFIG